MTSDASLAAAQAKLAAWQAASDELRTLEAALSRAMAEYATTLTESPRSLIIQVEAQRARVAGLFDIALEALDAHCVLRTGHTGFGSLN
jgi:hypothetical protein